MRAAFRRSASNSSHGAAAAKHATAPHVIADPDAPGRLARPAAALAPEVAEELRRAAADPAALRTATIAAIARRPAEVEAIVAEAAALATGSRAALAAAAASAFPGFAQRIEAAAGGAAPAAAAPPAARWSGEGSLGGARTSGNTETGDASASLAARYEGERWEHDLNLTFDYGSEDEETTRQRLLGNYESRFDFAERFYAFGFLEYEDDRFSGLEYEATEGAGLGYRIALAPPFT